MIHIIFIFIFVFVIQINYIYANPILSPSVYQNLYLSQSNLIFRAFDIPASNKLKKDINDVINCMISNGTWFDLDTLYMFNVETLQQSSINWKNPNIYSININGSPIFTPNQGYTGNGIDGDLVANNYNPSTAGLNFSLNSAVAGIYIRTAGTSASMTSISGNTMRLQRNGTNTAYVNRINDTTSSGSYTFGTQTGHFTLQRIDANNHQLFLNGSQISTGVANSTNIMTSFHMLSNLNTSAWSDQQISFAYTGGGSLNISSLNSCLSLFLLARGT